MKIICDLWTHINIWQTKLCFKDIVKSRGNLFGNYLSLCTICTTLRCKELTWRIFKNKLAVLLTGAMISHHGSPVLLPGSLGACWLCASLCQILIDWTSSAILGHFVKAVKFIGIQQAGRQSGDRAYFVVLIESRSPSLQAALNRREASGESITITCPLVILVHSTSPNLTARHELFTTFSVQYTQAPLTDCS